MAREFRFPVRIEWQGGRRDVRAEGGCLVAVSLDLPVETTVDVRTPLAVTT